MPDETLATPTDEKKDFEGCGRIPSSSPHLDGQWNSTVAVQEGSGEILPAPTGDNGLSDVCGGVSPAPLCLGQHGDGAVVVKQEPDESAFLRMDDSSCYPGEYCNDDGSLCVTEVPDEILPTPTGHNVYTQLDREEHWNNCAVKEAEADEADTTSTCEGLDCEDAHSPSAPHMPVYEVQTATIVVKQEPSNTEWEGPDIKHGSSSSLSQEQLGRGLQDKQETTRHDCCSCPYSSPSKNIAMHEGTDKEKQPHAEERETDAHESTHWGERPFKCLICSKVFRMSSHLTFHERVHGLNNRETRHDIEKTYKCEICGLTFRRGGNLKRHLIVHTDIKPFKCPRCPKSFRRKYNLDIHKRHHKDKMTCICKIGRKALAGKMDLNRHQNIHKGEEPLKCPTSLEALESEFLLNGHEESHESQVTYRCETCDMTFTQKSHLDRHSTIHTDLKSFKCSSCPKSFRMKSSLKIHERLHKGKMTYTCKTCGKAFTGKLDLNTHWKIHTEEPTDCRTSLQAYQFKSLLNGLVMISNSQRTDKCETCGLESKHMGSLNRHSAGHTGRNRFKCPTCPKLFDRERSLKFHELIHKGRPTYTCKTCGKAFTRKVDLNRHRNSHMREKPFEPPTPLEAVRP